MKKLLMCVMVAVALGGGMQLQGCMSPGQNAGGEKLVIQYATMKVIEADRDAMAERAARIDEIARSAQVFFSGESADVALLSVEVRKRLPADLSPADRVLANVLIDAVMAELQARVGSGLVPPDKRWQVNAVLGWIRETTLFYSIEV